jgi:rubrerythrin
MSNKPGVAAIADLADLFSVAYRIESDAVQRYTLLAEQMEIHNNPELVGVFRDLARAEGLHAGEIQRLAADSDMVQRAENLGTWPSGESPEEVDLAGAHYLMTPWHALQLSLAGEKRALDFFTSVVEAAKDQKVKEMAAEFVEEETEHVNLVRRLLRKYPEPSSSWSEDPDPPASQD